MSTHTYTLKNVVKDELVFSVVHLEEGMLSDGLQRGSLYTMGLVTSGEGAVQSDQAEYVFSQPVLMCFTPYQPFVLKAAGCKGFVLNFHPDFFCIHKHNHEVACNGVLFNNIYQPPFHAPEEYVVTKLVRIVEDMQLELMQEGLAQYELLVSLLKIFLITASRSRGDGVAEGEPPFVLQKLKDAIEEHYRQKHSAGDYAALLNMSPKALAKLTKRQFSRTLTDMIADRIIIEAKRELYLTSKPVKTIAYELGFNDEYHFSRYFKNKAAISPQVYRNKVGFARGENEKETLGT